MNDRERNNSGAGRDEDTGEPVAELRALAVQPRSGFLGGIRNRIQRKLLAGDLVDFSWKALAEALMEYLALLFGAWSTAGRSARRVIDESEQDK